MKSLVPLVLLLACGCASHAPMFKGALPIAPVKTDSAVGAAPSGKPGHSAHSRAAMEEDAKQNVEQDLMRDERLSMALDDMKLELGLIEMDLACFEADVADLNARQGKIESEVGFVRSNLKQIRDKQNASRFSLDGFWTVAVLLAALFLLHEARDRWRNGAAMRMIKRAMGQDLGKIPTKAA